MHIVFRKELYDLITLACVFYSGPLLLHTLFEKMPINMVISMMIFVWHQVRSLRENIRTRSLQAKVITEFCQGEKYDRRMSFMFPDRECFFPSDYNTLAMHIPYATV